MVRDERETLIAAVLSLPIAGAVGLATGHWWLFWFLAAYLFYGLWVIRRRNRK
jgi:hypothetical protein